MISSNGLIVGEVGNVHKKITRHVVNTKDHKQMCYKMLNILGFK
jgi:hypothetical protein